MKIVIDIPNDIYDDIKQVGHIYAVRQAHFVERVETITQAIANGTPLPKGELITKGQAVELVEWYQLNPQHFTFANLIDDIHDEKPVIEADKGE